jgi:hypothetical protein
MIGIFDDGPPREEASIEAAADVTWLVKLQRDFGDDASKRAAREVFDPDDDDKYLRTLLADDEPDDGPIETEKMLAENGTVEESSPDRRLADESPPQPTPDEQLVLDVLKRAKYFCADENLSARVVALEVLAVGCTLMAASPTHVLPLVHDLWPSLRARLPRSRGDVDAACKSTAASHSLAATLDVVSAFVGVVGDFLSFKFNDDVWPALELVLAHASQRKADTSDAAAPRRRAVAAALRRGTAPARRWILTL